MARLILPDGVRLGKFTIGEDLDVYDFEMPERQAKMVTTFRERTRYYTINDLDVGPKDRRHGIGRLLAGVALEHARTLQADLVVAGIISRECLEVMVDVFGEKNVEIRRRGDFAPEGFDSNEDDPTSAALLYDLR